MNALMIEDEYLERLLSEWQVRSLGDIPDKGG
jgi:hypothetical protein